MTDYNSDWEDINSKFECNDPEIIEVFERQKRMRMAYQELSFWRNMASMAKSRFDNYGGEERRENWMWAESMVDRADADFQAACERHHKGC